MANSSYQNTQKRPSQSTEEYLLGVMDNYAVTKDEPTEVRLDNITAPIDSQELITIGRRSIPKVNHDLNIVYPRGINGGVQCVVSIQHVISDMQDENNRIDDPVFMQLLWRCPMVGTITDEVLGEMAERLLSYLRHESDNSWRFSEILRGAIRPTRD